MPQDAGKHAGQRALGLMDVGIADSAGVNLDEHLARTGLRSGNFADFPLAMLCGNNGSFHLWTPFARGGPSWSMGKPLRISIGFASRPSDSLNWRAFC